MSENKKSKIKVLVVDDESIMQTLFTRILEKEDCQFVIAKDGEEAVEVAKKGTFDIAFIDVRLPKLNGLEVFRAIKKLNPRTKAYMMTGYAADELVKTAIKEGARGLIEKPFDISEIKNLLKN